MATRTRPPTIPITEIEHAAFCKTEDELPSKSLAEEQAVTVRWQKLPNEYLHYTAEELDQRIHRAKEELRHGRGEDLRVRRIRFKGVDELLDAVAQDVVSAPTPVSTWSGSAVTWTSSPVSWPSAGRSSTSSGSRR